MHDLPLAKAYGTKAILLNHGHKIAYGETEAVMCPKYLNAVYNGYCGVDVFAAGTMETTVELQTLSCFELCAEYLVLH